MEGYGLGTLPEAMVLAGWRRSVAQLYRNMRLNARPRAAWRAWRDGRDALARYHPLSPIDPAARSGFAGLRYYDYDEGLRFAVDVEAATSGETIETDLGAGGIIRMCAVARTNGLMDALGAELTIYWIEGYGGGLFLPFADATSGDETYGGGRYILDTIKGADLGDCRGRTVVDFNFVYNPSCAYLEAWTCPLAPPENRSPVPVRVGEKVPAEPGPVP